MTYFTFSMNTSFHITLSSVIKVEAILKILVTRIGLVRTLRQALQILSLNHAQYITTILLHYSIINL